MLACFSPDDDNDYADGDGFYTFSVFTFSVAFHI